MTPRSSTEASVDRFVDALIWNWIIVGTDAHAKHYSILLHGDDVGLAPLYDIASMLPYDRSHPRTWKFAMKYGGRYDVVSYAGNPWSKMAVELAVDVDRLTARALELCAGAPGAIADSIEARASVAAISDMPERLIEAVATRAAECSDMIERSNV